MRNEQKNCQIVNYTKMAWFLSIIIISVLQHLFIIMVFSVVEQIKHTLSVQHFWPKFLFFKQDQQFSFFSENKITYRLILNNTTNWLSMIY